MFPVPFLSASVSLGDADSIKGRRSRIKTQDTLMSLL